MCHVVRVCVVGAAMRCGPARLTQLRDEARTAAVLTSGKVPLEKTLKGQR
jgi:hypothetical protein